MPNVTRWSLGYARSYDRAGFLAPAWEPVPPWFVSWTQLPYLQRHTNDLYGLPLAPLELEVRSEGEILGSIELLRYSLLFRHLDLIDVYVWASEVPLPRSPDGPHPPVELHPCVPGASADAGPQTLLSLCDLAYAEVTGRPRNAQPMRTDFGLLAVTDPATVGTPSGAASEGLHLDERLFSRPYYHLIAHPKGPIGIEDAGGYLVAAGAVMRANHLMKRVRDEVLRTAASVASFEVDPVTASRKAAELQAKAIVAHREVSGWGLFNSWEIKRVHGHLAGTADTARDFEHFIASVEGLDRLAHGTRGLSEATFQRRVAWFGSFLGIASLLFGATSLLQFVDRPPVIPRSLFVAAAGLFLACLLLLVPLLLRGSDRA